MIGPTPLEYAPWRATRLGRITEAVERGAVFDLAGPVGGLDVLDVGCGDGAYAVALARRGARCSGVDLSAGALAQARRNARQAGAPVALAAADAARLPFPAGRFDLVVSVTALCFVASPDDSLREMARVLRPGGRVVLGVLGRLSAWGLWRTLRGRLGSPTWRRARLWTPSGLRRLVLAAGLEPVGVRGAAYHPPCGLAAATMRPLDALLGRTVLAGAAFLAISARQGCRAP